MPSHAERIKNRYIAKSSRQGQLTEKDGLQTIANDRRQFTMKPAEIAKFHSSASHSSVRSFASASSALTASTRRSLLKQQRSQGAGYISSPKIQVNETGSPSKHLFSPTIAERRAKFDLGAIPKESLISPVSIRLRTNSLPDTEYAGPAKSARKDLAVPPVPAVPSSEQGLPSAISTGELVKLYEQRVLAMVDSAEEGNSPVKEWLKQVKSQDNQSESEEIIDEIGKPREVSVRSESSEMSIRRMMLPGPADLVQDGPVESTSTNLSAFSSLNDLEVSRTLSRDA